MVLPMSTARSWTISGLHALAFSAWGRLAGAAKPANGVTFLYPPDDSLTLFHLDTVSVSYLSPFPKPLLFTFCNSGKELKRVQDATPFNSSTLVFLNFTSDIGSPCYFNLRPNSSAGFGANSDSFVLTNSQRSQTTVGLDLSPSTVSSTSPASQTSGQDTPAEPNGGDVTGGSSGGLGAGAQAGIGIGAALAGLAALGVAGAYLWRRRRQRAGMSDTSGVDEKPGGIAEPSPSVGDANKWQPQQQAVYPQELHAEGRTQEMPAVQSRPHELA